MNICFVFCFVVFDFDGMLIDSVFDIYVMVNVVLWLYWVLFLMLDQVCSFIGGGVDLLWWCVIVVIGMLVDVYCDLVVFFMICYYDVSVLMCFYFNVIEVLGVLVDCGYFLVICINKFLGLIKVIFGYFGIVGMFVIIIGGDSLLQKKFDFVFLCVVFVGLGLDFQVGFYVGDSEFDVECVVNIDVLFFLYICGYCKILIEQMWYSVNFDDYVYLFVLIDQCVLVG